MAGPALDRIYGEDDEHHEVFWLLDEEAWVATTGTSPKTTLGLTAIRYYCDVPSGLCATTGAIVGATPDAPDDGVAVRAHETLTFVGPKAGFFVGEGPAHVGRWRAAEIGFPVEEAAAWVKGRRAGG